MGSQGADCYHTLNDETEQMTLQQFAAWWDDLSDPKIATRVSSFVAYKADVEKLCSLGNFCTYEQQQAVTQLSGKLDKAISMAKKANGK